MNIYTGQIISKGIAYGKVGFLSRGVSSQKHPNDSQNQMEILRDALHQVSVSLDAKIEQSLSDYNERIAEIFETHKYIVNDPILIEMTEAYIKKNYKANQAYSMAIRDIMSEFEKIDNEYMLGRIVDIIDATDQVKAAMDHLYSEKVEDFDESTILILSQLKPSIIYALNHTNVVGFISKKGFYHQHSGMIARTLNVPGMIQENLDTLISEGDYVLLDANEGNIYVNPDRVILEKIGGNK